MEFLRLWTALPSNCRTPEAVANGYAQGDILGRRFPH